MAEDQKISQLPEALTLAEDDYVPIVQASSGLNKKAKVSAFVPDPSFIENAVNKIAGQTLEVGKINLINIGADTIFTLPTAGISYKGKVLIVKLDNNPNFNLTINGAAHGSVILTKFKDSVIFSCVDTNETGNYFWFDISKSVDIITQTITNGVTDKSPSEDAVFDALALKLDLDGGNANQDIDIDGFGVNAKHFKVNGTGGAGHIGLKHQSADISASASESSIGADSVGDPVWKNDGGAIDKLELQSNKTSTVTGNEASTSKYLTVKGVYDWAVGLFAPKASPTFTGTVTTPDIVVSNATGSTPAFFDAVDKLISTTAQLWGTWVQTWASKATPVDADTIGFYNSATTFVGVKSTLLNFWTTYLLPKIQALGYLTGSLSTNYIPYWNGTSLVNSLATNNIVDGGIDINSGYIYARKTTGGYVANFDFRSTSGSAAIIGSQQTKALLVEGNTNRTTSDPASVIINRVTSGELAWFQAFDANATQRNGISKQSASIYLQRSGRNSSAADIANDGYNVGIFAQLSPNTTANKDINGSFNFTQIDYVNNKGAWIAYISNIQVASIGQDGVSVGSNAINASAILQAESTTKGFLPPRMTNAQRTAIASPAIGLMVYCTDATEGIYVYKSTGWTFIA